MGSTTVGQFTNVYDTNSWGTFQNKFCQKLKRDTIHDV